MNFLNQLLQLTDCFTLAPFLMLNKKELVSTRFSQVMSLILISFTIRCIVQESVSLFYQEQYAISDVNVALNYNYSVEYDQADFMLAVKFQNQALQDEYKKYFKIYYEQIQNNNTANQIIGQKQYLLEQCTYDHFTGIEYQNYLDLKLDKALCLPLNTKTTLVKNPFYQSSANFKVVYCNTGDNDGQCLNIKNDTTAIATFLKKYKSYKFSFDLYLMNTLFQIKNINSPIIKQINNVQQYFDLRQQFSNVFVSIMKPYIFEQDTRPFADFSDVDSTSGIFLDMNDIKTQIIYQQDSDIQKAIFQIVFFPASELRSIQIVYNRFLDMILNIMGSLELVIIIFELICGWYNTLEYQRQVLNKIFNQKQMFGYKDILNFFSLEEKFSNDKLELLEKYMDVSWIIKSCVEQKKLVSMLVSEKSEVMKKIMMNPPPNVNQLEETLQNEFHKKKNKQKSKSNKAFTKLTNVANLFNKNQIKQEQIFQKQDKNTNVDNQVINDIIYQNHTRENLQKKNQRFQVINLQDIEQNTQKINNNQTPKNQAIQNQNSQKKCYKIMDTIKIFCLKLQQKLKYKKRQKEKKNLSLKQLENEQQKQSLNENILKKFSYKLRKLNTNNIFKTSLDLIIESEFLNLLKDQYDVKLEYEPSEKEQKLKIALKKNREKLKNTDQETKSIHESEGLQDYVNLNIQVDSKQSKNEKYYNFD